MFAVFKKAATRKASWAYSNEIKAMAFLGLGVFLAACILSYNPTDLSWFYYDTLHRAPSNWCGYVGACMAATLFYLFGVACIIVVSFCFYLFYFYLYKKTIRQEWDRIGAYILVLLTAAVLCSVHAIGFFNNTVAGGYFGLEGKKWLHYWLDDWGAIILLYTLIAACIIVIARFSFIRVFRIMTTILSLRSLYAYIIKPAWWILSSVYTFLDAALGGMADMVKNYFGSKQAQLEKHDWAHEMNFWQELLYPAPLEPEVPHATHVAPAHENTPSQVASPHEAQPVSPEAQAVVFPDLPGYELPRLDLFIGVDEEVNDQALIQELEKRAVILQEKLERFGVYGKVSAIKRGPIVTLFEYQPQIDTKISKIIALEDDLSLALQATSIRIIAPIPGRSVVGFEVANKNRRNVLLSTLIKSEAYKETNAHLPMILGVDTIGNTVIIDLAKMPHLLIAGSTGSGKSVALNAMLVSLLCKISPDDLRLIVIDPKRLEFAPYADIAHLLFPIVTDVKLAPSVLRWVVKQMESRYQTMALVGARNILDYHQLAKKNQYEPMPFIAIIIDELADLMMTSGKEVEDAIIRITQMARAAGIHLIAATQRPSVDVITGIIKVNFPSRISFRVTSKIDSRTILDSSGADKLLGRGDMLFLDAHDSLLKRVHGAYVLDKEINQVIGHIKSQRKPDYLDLKQVCQDDRIQADAQEDELYQEVCNYVQSIEEISISLLQRRFHIGYNRSARIIDMLESQGLIAPSYGGKTRKVIR